MVEEFDELPWWDSFRIKALKNIREGMDLYPFQHLAVYKSVEFPNTYTVVLPTGTGKTLVAYSISELYKAVYPNTKLIIVTNSSAVIQCEKEYEKFFIPEENHRSIAFHKKMHKFGEKSYAQSRKKAIEVFGTSPLCGGLDCMVMNYPMFRIENQMINGAITNLSRNEIGTIIIFDEATHFKGRKTQTHKAVLKSTPLAEKIIGLTATLTKGKLEDTFEIMKAMGILISPTKAEFYNDFVIYTKLPNSYQKIVHGYKNIPEFKRRLSEFSLTLEKKDVARYLPKINLRPLRLEQTPEQIKVIGEKMIETNIELVEMRAQAKREKTARKEWEKEEESAHAKWRQDKFLEGNEYEYKKQISREEFYDDWENFDKDHNYPEFSFPKFKFPKFVFPEEKIYPVELLTEQGLVKRTLQDLRLTTREELEETKVRCQSPKTKELIRLLSDELVDEKVVVYTPSKEYLKILEKTIKSSNSVSNFYKNKIGMIHGEIDIQTREDFRKEFTDTNNINLMFINNAGSEALNLQAGSILIIMGMPETGGAMVQVVGRISRLGSKYSNLYVFCILMENSQDMDEYLNVNQQMQLMEALGQGEPGLIDYDYLKEIEESKIFEEVDKETLMLKSRNEILYSGRTRRTKFYGVKNV